MYILHFTMDSPKIKCKKILNSCEDRIKRYKHINSRPEINIFENITIIGSALDSILLFIIVFLEGNTQKIIIIFAGILNILVLLSSAIYKIFLHRTISPEKILAVEQSNNYLDEIKYLQNILEYDENIISKVMDFKIRFHEKIQYLENRMSIREFQRYINEKQKKLTIIGVNNDSIV